MRSARGGTLALTLCLASSLAVRAAAQEFTPPGPGGPGPAPGGFLENALPPAGASPAFAAAFTSWFGLPELGTCALAAAAGIGTVRLAAGIAQTGERDIGWDAGAVAGGVALGAGGAGMRVVARRDRAVEPGSAGAASLEARAGLEAGWGAWLRAAPGLTLWAAVPQAWAAGTAPPLDRPLEIGARGDAGGLSFWLSRSAPPAGGAPGHAAAVSLASGPLQVWAAARDRPLRGGIGVAAAAGRLRAAAGIESHPDLGETVRLALGLGGHGP